MQIYTYHASVPEGGLMDDLRLNVLWRRTWEARGVETFTLSEWHARQHPMFAEFDKVVSALPSINPASYERACFLRWLALAQVGGGWMADFDLFPQGETEPLMRLLWGLEGGQMKILQVPCCPAMVWASPGTCERFCKTIIEQPQLGSRPQDGREHISDQYVLETLVENRTDWLTTRDIVKLYSDVGWEKAPLVHFANAVMMRMGLMPRWKEIPKLIPT